MNFSVVIPTRARPDTLARCLRMLPSEAEVIVSDDGKDASLGARLAHEFPAVRCVGGPGRGPAANRNHGARQATREWVAFLDDDCEPQPDWLAAFAAAAPDADVLEGRTVAPGATGSPFEELVENEGGGVLWSCNLAVRREVFLKLGGFDEDFREAAGEDMEFAWRVARAGLRVRFVPGAVVHHPPRRIGWRGLWKRVWQIRWMALYRIKTGAAPALGAPALAVGGALVANETTEVLRIALHAVTRPSSRRHAQIFHAARRVVTLPFVLPYLLAWEFRFRATLAARRIQPHAAA